MSQKIVFSVLCLIFIISAVHAYHSKKGRSQYANTLRKYGKAYRHRPSIGRHGISGSIRTHGKAYNHRPSIGSHGIDGNTRLSGKHNIRHRVKPKWNLSKLLSYSRIKYMFFYKHSVFQSEARICLSFSQIEPQKMLKICLS